MRNMTQYAKQGLSKLEKHLRYDLCASEIEPFYQLIMQSNGKGETSQAIWDVITTVYYAGIESGYRMRKNEE